MKQLIFMVVTMGYFSLRSLGEPFWAILMYYGLSILRPQWIWQWALPEVRWSLIATGVLALAILLNPGCLERRLVKRWFIGLVFFFGLCLAGSYFQAMDQEIAGRSGWEYAKVLMTLIVSCFIVDRVWHVRYLAYAICGSLVYLAYEVNAQYIVQHRLDIYHYGYGGLDNNGAALMLAMAVPFCFYFFQAERRWWRWAFLLCIPPVAHAVMLTYSRGAMLSLSVVWIGILISNARRRFTQSACLGLLTMIVVLVLAGAQIRARMWTLTREERDASARSRLDSWQAGLRIAQDYPLFGVGLRNSGLVIRGYGADYEGRTIHDIYLQIAADSGIPAAAAFLAMILLTLRNLREGARRANRYPDDSEMRWHACVCDAAFWSLAIFALASIFVSSETLEIAYLLMLMGAVAPALSEPEEVASEGLAVATVPPTTRRPHVPLRGNSA